MSDDGPHTSRQLKAYWCVVREISECLYLTNGKRYSMRAWHEYFKGEFIGWREHVDAQGTETRAPLSTGTLSRLEFSDYFAQVEARAIELGMEFYK